MNATQLAQLLLLEQSGELAPKQRRELDAELAASAETRRLRAELRSLAAAIPPPATQLAPDAAARIAARLDQASRPATAFQPMWKPVLAAAAALALLLGVRTYQAHKAPVAPETTVASVVAEEWTDPLEAEFTELESLIAALAADDAFEITEL